MTYKQRKALKEALLNLCNQKKDSKIYLMTCLNEISKKINVSPKEATAMIQELYLTSDYDFTFDLSKTRNGYKIVGLKPCNIDVIEIEYLEDNMSGTNGHLCYMCAQFKDKVSSRLVYDITRLYELLIDNNKDILYIAINRNSDNIYKKVESKFTVEEVDELLDLIKKYGYCYEDDDNILYWKTYSPNIELDSQEIAKYFTVISKPTTMVEDEQFNIQIQEEQASVEEIPIKAKMTPKDALSVIAKEFGMTLSEDNSKNKLDELIATTTELIKEFDRLPDWEKLRNWKKFMEDWSLITGEALNDRN